MDDTRFDQLTKSLGQGASRRSALKTLLGIGGIAATSAIVLRDADAARRGSPGGATQVPAPTQPPLPTATVVPPTATASCPGALCTDGCCDGACTTTGACCPSGSTVCGPDCCPNGAATCCDNACCYGQCWGEELCCPTDAVCGDACCDLGSERCCVAASGMASCIAAGSCCGDGDCGEGRCQNGVCVPFTPTSTPTATQTPPPTSTATPSTTPSPTPTSSPPGPSILISEVIGCRVLGNFFEFTPGTRYILQLVANGSMLQNANLTPNSSGQMSWQSDQLPCDTSFVFFTATDPDGNSFSSGTLRLSCDC